jgi:hypothetical protein
MFQFAAGATDVPLLQRVRIGCGASSSHLFIGTAVWGLEVITRLHLVRRLILGAVQSSPI